MINLQQFEFGLIGLILANVAGIGDAGTNDNELVAATDVLTIEASFVTTPPDDGALWFVANAGDYQRIKYSKVVAGIGDSYTFTVDAEIKTTIAAATVCYFENYPIVVFSDTEDIDWPVYIQTKITDNTKDEPDPTIPYWTNTASVSVVTRIPQDKERDFVSALFSAIEFAIIHTMTAAALTATSAVTINGHIPQQSEEGLFSGEFQTIICTTELKYNYV